jgi:hypothetical protein
MRSIPKVAVLVGLTACAASAPIQLGNYQAIAPRIDPVAKEAIPLHVQVALGRPENVAVFFVVPGRGATLLYPVDSASPTRLTAGAHILTTVLAQRTTRDSLHIAHPNTTGAPLQMPNTGPRNSAATVMSADSVGRVSTDGYLLLFATDDSLDYNTLQNRVTGISIPIENDAAVSTVTKLIKGTIRGNGAWAAYSTEFVNAGDHGNR